MKWVNTRETSMIELFSKRANAPEYSVFKFDFENEVHSKLTRSE